MAEIIDAHQHYWKVSQFNYGWTEQGVPELDQDFLPRALEPQLESAGVNRSILVQVLHRREETDWMLQLAQRHPSIAGVVGWVDLTQDPDTVRSQLTELRQDPVLVGIRHLVHEEPDDEWLSRPDVRRGLQVLEAADVPFDLLLRPQHLRLVPGLSSELPGLRMVINHLAKPDIRSGVREPWQFELRAAAENPLLWCKVSGMITEADHETWTPSDLAPYVEAALEAFGAKRLMFGSDWPVCTLAGSYARVIAALREVLGGASSSDEQAIFGGNATDFYQPKGTT
ncbi:MAG TPA: amidohydrolase family protein [Pseudolysinimonas sp.]